jgi:hypothetical protein
MAPTTTREIAMTGRALVIVMMTSGVAIAGGDVLGPRWAERGNRAAPQLPDPGGWFAEAGARRQPAPDEPALLLCQVVVTGDFDSIARADLLVTFQFAGRAPISIWGPEDTDVATLSVPRIRLRKGDLVRATVLDRDVTEREYIGRVQDRFTGEYPFRMESKHVSLECRAIAQSLLESARQEAFADLDEALERDERDGEEHEDDSLRRLLIAAAAFDGWAQPEVQRRVRRLAALEARKRPKSRD